MSTLAPEEPKAVAVAVARDELVVRLEDGREIRVPLRWFPALRNASAQDLADWRLIGGGVGIHWPRLDEDLSVRGLLSPGPTAPPGRGPG